MPELPEVETLCLQLRRTIAGEEILESRVMDSRLGVVPPLAGRKVSSVFRRGKSVAIELDGAATLAIHLRMTGGLRWRGASPLLLPYSRFMVLFSAGELVLVDPRRFATVSVQATPVRSAPVAMDPLRDFSLTRLREAAENKRLSVKSFLMDQRVIAGIGNIYACEILHAAAINPRRETGSLTTAEWREVKKAAVSIIRKAVACRGTTVSDWRDLFGNEGEYQNHLQAYARAGEPCRRCRADILRAKLAGRGAYFCPSCQR
ncbi:MAG: bifunctional DNA-formamidopyrimidine glycosylase/DNA-(apurinic or apyrimidinic site) lyase [Deltaproteobacteria bacterium]|nr:bifunctional DNA-formamidopyrimidine glycosylase/DNA-(apurinic or apyrimidinic site) lyase [Deltaproteobacteria bacterium]